MSDQVVKEGYKTLSKEERKAYHSFNQSCITSGGGGGIEIREIEAEIKQRLNAFREEIASMKKNPFMPEALRILLIMAILEIGGILLTALVEKLIGSDLRYVYIGFSSVTAFLALRFADQLIKAFRFKTLQKAYEDPAFQESEINAAVFRLLKDSVVNKMNIEKYGIHAARHTP